MADIYEILEMLLARVIQISSGRDQAHGRMDSYSVLTSYFSGQSQEFNPSNSPLFDYILVTIWDFDQSFVLLETAQWLFPESLQNRKKITTYVIVTIKYCVL